jgi:hypothetical protein
MNRSLSSIRRWWDGRGGAPEWRTADPSASLGMTKGAVALPFGIGCWDPRSQTRDLGHPSISPFDIAEGTSFVISLPTRLSESASLGMTRRELGFTGNWLHGFQVSNGAEPGGIAYSRSLSRATCVRR